MNKSAQEDTARRRSGDLLKLILYWSVALIPLVWGIIMTINKALALFR